MTIVVVPSVDANASFQNSVSLPWFRRTSLAVPEKNHGISESEISRKNPDIHQNISGMLSGSREYRVNIHTPSTASLFCLHSHRWGYIAIGKIIYGGFRFGQEVGGNTVSDTLVVFHSTYTLCSLTSINKQARNYAEWRCVRYPCETVWVL